MDQYSLTLNAGEKWSAQISRNKSIRLTALGAGANLAMLAYRAEDHGERINLPDSLKAQHTAKLTQGNVVYTDMGRVLFSITQDSLGWHDPIGGLIHRDQVDARYGMTRFQEHRNSRLMAGYENMLTELGKWGMNKRDIVPNINWFSRIWAEESGAIHVDAEHCQAGATVTLRTELDVVMVFSNTPHPLDTRSTYPSVPVQIDITRCTAASMNDECRNSCSENRRAFENNESYFFLAGAL